MGKRSPGLARRKHDAYDTIDPRAVQALLPHLPDRCRYIEPCAGEGVLLTGLRDYGHHCAYAFDIKPSAELGALHGATRWKHDARTFRVDNAQHPIAARYFITNPPWTRSLLHAIILNLYWQLPTWLLFDADWMHTQQASPYMPLCRKIISVGRLRWIPDTDTDGKDNAAWYLFAPGAGAPEFVGRQP
jgi:hypothetical protein